MELFLEHFLDAFSPLHGEVTSVIREAAKIRIFSPLLHDAYQAVSAMYFGRSFHDPRIESIGVKIYSAVLRTLQQALDHPDQNQSQGVLVTVALLIIFEVNLTKVPKYRFLITDTAQAVQRTTKHSMVHHWLGVLRLLECRGPRLHIFGLEHQFFTELRLYWVSTLSPGAKVKDTNEYRSTWPSSIERPPSSPTTNGKSFPGPLVHPSRTAYSTFWTW